MIGQPVRTVPGPSEAGVAYDAALTGINADVPISTRVPPAVTAGGDVSRAARSGAGGVGGATLALAWREVVRFLRQRNRVIGALLTPVLFWILLGVGMGEAFRAPGSGQAFMAYFFPGMLLMVVLFTAIFSTISLIEDRREGFMQAVLVCPAPRVSVVLGKCLGGGGLAWGQAMLILPLAPLAGLPFDAAGYAVAALFLAGLSVGLVALGTALAWPMTSTQGYHVLMNLLLMPMWFLSGAVFPAGSGGLRWLTAANPLTWGLEGVRAGLSGDLAGGGAYPLWACAAVTASSAGAAVGLAWFVARRPVRADVE